jgi:hypothetical protein
VNRISDWNVKSPTGSRSAPKRKKSAYALAALAMGLALGLSLSAASLAAAADSPITPELHDPQLVAFPPLGGSPEDPPVKPPVITPAAAAAAAAQRQRELNDQVDSPMAPLPPAIVAGPIGIAWAGWMAYRANRRGGRI